MADTYHARGVDEDVWTPRDNLFAGDENPFERKGTLAAGENRLRGTVLGRVTAGGQLKMSLAAAGDGSQTASVILAHDCDATAAAAECVFYEAGTFNENALTLGAGHTVASIREGLRALGIHLRKNLPA